MKPDKHFPQAIANDLLSIRQIVGDTYDMRHHHIPYGVHKLLLRV